AISQKKHQDKYFIDAIVAMKAVRNFASQNKRLFNQIHGITKVEHPPGDTVPAATTPQNNSTSTKSSDQTVANTERPNESSTASAEQSSNPGDNAGKNTRTRKFLNAWTKAKQGIMGIATGTGGTESATAKASGNKKVSTDTNTKDPSSIPPNSNATGDGNNSSNNNTSLPAKTSPQPNNQLPGPSNVVEEKQSEKENQKEEDGKDKPTRKTQDESESESVKDALEKPKEASKEMETTHGNSESGDHKETTEEDFFCGFFKVKRCKLKQGKHFFVCGYPIPFALVYFEYAVNHVIDKYIALGKF
ncbi:hypothetical protein RFI_23310, partial [Reticulomyxa filosa]